MYMYSEARFAIPNGTARIGPPANWYANHLLWSGTIDWGCFRPVTTRNRLVTIDFDCRCLMKGGISLAATREKEEEGEKEGQEKGEPGDPVSLFLDDPDPSLPSLVGRRRRGEEGCDVALNDIASF
ncbi:hypothetical protein B296_00058907 [Ensete ventricosum]|uniref:Uncharacterized protein n=1 Tax=Ensete ventricosum TaxID=4639 RepID=A0A426XJY9_ENSVE|nr:hypothetical protein B296_00058907 [Ensete ventricosum]